MKIYAANMGFLTLGSLYTSVTVTYKQDCIADTEAITCGATRRLVNRPEKTEKGA